MTLEEAIKYCEDMAVLSHKGSGNAECEQNFRQFAEWLRELKAFREMEEELDFVKPHKKISVNLDLPSAEETEAYPISENILKGFKEFTELMFKRSDFS